MTYTLVMCSDSPCSITIILILPLGLATSNVYLLPLMATFHVYLLLVLTTMFCLRAYLAIACAPS